MKESQQLIRTFDQHKTENFANFVAETVIAGAVALMLSVGHKLELFEMLADSPPSTSQQIADRAGFAERYVREWLAVMVVSKILKYEPTEKTYYLPAEHAACLTQTSPSGNLAVYAQFIPLMSGVYPKLLDLFKDGGGLSYQDFLCFHDVMSEDSAQSVVNELIETILPLACDLPHRLKKGIHVLDAGCSKGLALLKMAKEYPDSYFTGYDFCSDAIEQAKSPAQNMSLKNISFETFDLTNLTDFSCYDLITSFDAVHDQKDPEKFLGTIYRALKPGGVHLMQDIGGSAQLEKNSDFPMAALLYTISCTHCTPVSLSQGGVGLGTMWGRETAFKMLKQAGFQSIDQKVFDHDPMNIWFVSRKAAT
jgi:ubiquinone/menaquinone biosynthesis C-methylase UbiE